MASYREQISRPEKGILQFSPICAKWLQSPEKRKESLGTFTQTEKVDCNKGHWVRPLNDIQSTYILDDTETMQSYSKDPTYHEIANNIAQSTPQLRVYGTLKELELKAASMTDTFSPVLDSGLHPNSFKQL